MRGGQTGIGLFAGHIVAGNLQIHRYPPSRLVRVTAATHPLAGHSAINLMEALDEDFIGLQRDASLQTLISDAARSAGKCMRIPSPQLRRHRSG